VRWNDTADKEWEMYPQPENWDVNQMYVDEMRHFLDCLVGQRPTTLPIPEAVALMRVAFAAKTSSQDGRMIAIAGEIQR
jgi:predicted dehydrogenase